MAFTQQQYEDLVAALAEGISSVSSNGRQTSFRSVGDMLKLKSIMEEELGITGAGRRRHYVAFQRD